MKKTLKTIGSFLLAIIGIAIVAIAVFYLTGRARSNQHYNDFEQRPLTIPEGPEALALGEKWADTLCTNCHAPDLSGRLLIDDPGIGIIAAPNLTPGQGGIGRLYTDEDWVRALRHGVATDYTPLMGMPSDAFYYMNDEDLGGLIAYLKALPPVDNTVTPLTLKPMSYILISLGAFGDVFPAEHIRHEQVPPAPAPGVTLEYGQYLVRIGDCDNCHGPHLSGGESPVPGSPPGPNLTPGGTVAFWTAEEFITTMRTGATPYGRQLDPEYMPWKEYTNLSDDELSAILLFLQSLPTLETGE